MKTSHITPKSLGSVLLSLFAIASTLLAADPAQSASTQASEPQTAITIGTQNGPRMRVEAVDPQILRIWVKPAGAGDFTRKQSLATDAAPTTRIALTQTHDQSNLSAPATVIDTGALTLRVDERTLGFTVFSDATITPTPLMDAAHIYTTVPQNSVDGVGAWTLTHNLARSEHIFGFGEDNQNLGHLDRRGVIRIIWNGQQINSGNVTAENPVPFFLSTGRDGRAYGIFYDDAHRLRFDLGKTNPDQVRLDADGGEIDFYVIDGPTVADVIERYTRIVGRPALPPLWALGYWQSKCTYWDWNMLDEAYHQLDSRGFPVDVMIIDADWPEFVNNYQWAKRWIETAKPGTPADKIAAYAKKGVRIVMSQSGPMIKKDSPTYTTGTAAGVFATDGKGNTLSAGYYDGQLLDFTHPKINDWLWPQTRKLNEIGTAGWWLDLNEPEGEPPQTHYVGGRPANVHNEFAHLTIRSFEGVQLDVHPNQRPFVLSRAASAGAQRHHAATWTGDIFSDFATLRAHPPEMLNSTLSGLTYWTCDTGGFLAGYYKDDQYGAHARLYERWFQFSSFAPVTRAHKAGGPPEPYQYGPAAEQGVRHYLKLRYRLMPYLYTHAWIASETGLPITRALALEFPGDPQAAATPGDQFLFGSQLLVAPVLYDGLTNRKVYVPVSSAAPDAPWVDWDTGVDYTPGREWVVAAPQNRIPLLVRPGAIIPTAPEMKNTSEKNWDPLTIEIFPAGQSNFTLYQDDGITFNYKKGDFTTTRFACDESPTSGFIRFTLDESGKKYTPREYITRFHLRQTPAAITLDGASLDTSKWTWDVSARVLTVAFPAGDATSHALAIKLDGKLLASRPAPELKADVYDTKSEASNSIGKPVPHFFPPTELPATIKASNYDKGGEGVAFHAVRQLPASATYRPDSFSLVETSDTGGGYALANLSVGEWTRTTIDTKNGGWFDLTARVASAVGAAAFHLMDQDRVIATIDVPKTGSADKFTDVKVPGIYLNPGEVTIMLIADKADFAINTLAFAKPAKSSPRYPAMLAQRHGVAEIVRADAQHSDGFVKNLGRAGSSITLGMDAGTGGAKTLRIHYSSGIARDVALSLKINDAPEQKLPAPNTKDAWKDLDIPVKLEPGVTRITITGQEENWESVQIEYLELL